jgi:hypothetical protein
MAASTTLHEPADALPARAVDLHLFIEAPAVGSADADLSIEERIAFRAHAPEAAVPLTYKT